MVMLFSMNTVPLPAAPKRLAAYLKPPLKWAGGKRWLAPHLRALWHYHRGRRFVELFCGGLAVSLELRPRVALLNDVNIHLINFYSWLQKGLVLRLSMKNDRELYYRYRIRFNQLIATGQTHIQEAAKLFYYLNRTGYNGLCRFSRNGRFNTPYGRYSAITYTTDFTAYRPVLARWSLRSGDFAQLAVQPDDFMYADPPYDVSFAQYAQGGFTWADQERLALWLARHPGPVVASNHATARIVRLYTLLGFRIIYLNAPRHISCTGDRTPAQEIVAYKRV